jgi:sugar-phosphatase
VVNDFRRAGAPPLSRSDRVGSYRPLPPHSPLCETVHVPTFHVNAILFDLDGVLLDSTPSGSRIWTAWANQHHLDPAYVVHIGHGRPTVETVRLVAPHLDAPHQAELIEQAEIADVAGLEVLPGARALLAALPPDRYTIVTSGGRRLATTRLHAVGLPIPPTMITASDITRGKPDPQPYLAGAAALGFDPRTCLVFEDAPSGIRAAHAAGATVIALPTTYPQNELSTADLIIPSLAAVSATMDQAHNPPLRIEIATS